ncbi:MAG: enoyl-CoA hydratase [Bacillota bacterium]|nr:enoyl-CoA hydratase [Bacillota bacterium]
MTINFVTEKVQVTVDGRVATVAMNRPESLNALDNEMIKGLVSTLKDINESDEIDIVVLRGEGKAFCSGGDIKSMITMKDERDFFPIMESINELIVTLYTMPKLTIAAVNGAAAGLGFSLAMATDFIIADSTSVLAMNFIGIGLIPDGGAHFFLEKRMGEMKTKQLIWEGKGLSANEALKLGLIHEVSENGIDVAVEARVSDWLQRPIEAMVKTKMILAEKNRPQLLKMLELEKHGQFKMRQTQDHREGIQAFVEKRKPMFIGK